MTNFALASIHRVMKKIKKIKVNDTQGSSLRPGVLNLILYQKITNDSLYYVWAMRYTTTVTLGSFENIPYFVIFFKHCDFDLILVLILLLRD